MILSPGGPTVQGVSAILLDYITGVWDIRSGKQFFPLDSVAADAELENDGSTDDETGPMAGMPVDPHSDSDSEVSSTCPKMHGHGTTHLTWVQL